jgi:hypothetical protein
MKPMTLSLVPSLAALLLFAVQVAPSEAGYKGNCDHWKKAAYSHRKRGDERGYDAAMARYYECHAERIHAKKMQDLEKTHGEQAAKDVLLGVGIDIIGVGQGSRKGHGGGGSKKH